MPRTTLSSYGSAPSVATPEERSAAMADGCHFPMCAQPSLAGGNRLQHYAMQITNRQLCALAIDTRTMNQISAGYEVMFVQRYRASEHHPQAVTSM